MNTVAFRRKRELFVSTAILLFLFGAYSVAIDRFPPFIDEMIHVHGSEQGYTISPLENVDLGRQFTIWWMMLFQTHREAPIWISRIATLLTGMVAAASVIAIGRLAGGLWGAALAGLLYVFSAYNHFFSRLALADPIAGAAVLLAIYFAYRLRRRATVGDAVLTGLCLFLAVGAKVSVIPYLGIIVAAAAALSPPGRPWREQVRWAVVALAVAIVSIVALVAGFRLLGHDFLSNSFSYALTNRGATSPSTLLDANRIAANIRFTFEIIAGYLGLIPTIGALVAVGWLLARRRFYLPLCLVGPLLVVWLNQIQESRYLYVPGALLMLCAAIVLADIVSKSQSPVRVAIVGLVMVWGGVQWLPFALTAADDPARLPLPEVDVLQYVHSDAAGFALADVRDYLLERQPRQVVGLLANCNGLRYLSVADFPVECPVLSPDGSRVDELADLLNARRAGGVYAVLEDLPYVPATSPGKLVHTVERIGDRRVLSIFDLSPET